MAIGVGYKREHESNQMERIECAPGDGALRMACDVFLLATEATKAAASKAIQAPSARPFSNVGCRLLARLRLRCPDSIRLSLV
jgi:hypothetical protein